MNGCRALVLAFLLFGWLLPSPAAAAPKGIPLAEIMEAYDTYAKIAKHVKTGADIFRKGVEAGQKAHKPLTPADDEVWRSLGGGPEIPYRCARDPDCRSCYEPAFEKFRHNRFKLAKARAILLNSKQYYQSMVSFGDSLSSGLGSAGLGWTFARPKVELEWKKLKMVYRRKVDEFLFRLEEALMDMGRCEARVYGDDDWYDRFGILYLDFLRTTYATIPG